MREVAIESFTGVDATAAMWDVIEKKRAAN